MKRWEEILKEEPSKELTAVTERRVFPELNALAPSRRGWMQWAAVVFGMMAVVGGYRLSRREELNEGQELLDLAMETDLNLDELEDLEVIEILEELEEWTG